MYFNYSAPEFKKSYYLWFLTFIFLYQLILCFQGFDVCDEGWCLAFYQNIFASPQSSEYQFVYYLTGLFGGIFYSVFPDGGILYFRVLNTACNILCCIMVYNLLKSYISGWQIIIGTALVIFNFGYITAFHHNNLTSVLVLFSVLVLYKGLVKNSMLLVALSGLILAITIFARFPNVTMLVLALLIPLNSFLLKRKFKTTIRELLIFSSGVLSGLVIMGSVIFLLGHWKTMVDSVQGILNKGSSGDSNHNFLLLFKIYISNYIQIFKSALIFGCSFLVIVSLIRFTSNKISLIRFLGIAASFIICSGLMYKFFNIYMLYAVSFSGLSVLLFLWDGDRKIKLLAFAAILIMVFNPLGSDGGVNNFGPYCLWLSLPLAIYGLTQLNEMNFSADLNNYKVNFLINKLQLNLFLAVIGSSFFCVLIFRTSRYAYFDEGSRLKKVYAINAPLARGIFTTQSRAEIMNAVLPEIKKHVLPGDYLFAYDNIPMINFLTQTRPYLGTAWVWVYDSYSFNASVQKAEKRSNERPVVLLQKFMTIGRFSQPFQNYLSEERPDDYIWKQGRTRSMNNFLRRNKYRVVWSNAYFEILKPGL